MKFIKIFALILFALSSGGCRSNAPAPGNSTATDAGVLTVSAAVSLKEAFGEIGELYKNKTGRAISFNYGASGALQKQIETGAPVDLFASAGEQQMDELAAKNLIDGGTRRDFAGNTLVLIVPADSKMGITAFGDLTRPEIQKIAAGNPKTVPAGQYTDQVLEKTGLKKDLQPKLIFGEDVRQVLDYVVRGETDAGIVYGSDALGAGDKVRTADVAPEETHAPIFYPAAIIKDSRRKAAAQSFLELLLSPEGQAVLRKYGFRQSKTVRSGFHRRDAETQSFFAVF